jgi:SAM-dependent methyltransferase
VLPICTGSDASFADLRSFLYDSGYTQEGVCRRAGVSSLAQLLTWKPRLEPDGIEQTVDLLISLFLLGEYASLQAVERLMPPPVFEAMGKLGLIAPAALRAARVQATVSLYPVQNLYIASDRWNSPEATPVEASPDIVYPAITPNTLRFLRLLPAEPCSSLLDLCSGTAVGALHAATNYSELSCAVDITERATAFAQFNQRLNGVTNAEVLQGDLYEPVGDRVFDRIIAHPPYVPASQTTLIFQDATEGGESITRRIIEGLPRHLKPGGCFYCLTLGADREKERYEARIRRWLGASEAEFDVLLVVIERRSPDELASDFLLKGQIDYKEFLSRKQQYSSDAEEYLYTLVVLQKAASPRAAFTLRRLASPKTASREVEWLRRLQTALVTPGQAPDLSALKPRAADPIECSGVYKISGGKIETTSFTIEVDSPLYGMLGVEPWAAQLLAACDGSRTGAELYSHCRAQGWIHEQVTPTEFYAFLKGLLSGGFLSVRDFTPPEAAE